MSNTRQGPPRPRPKPKSRHQMREALPGYKEAVGLGYSLNAYAGSKKMALYSKGRLSLKVYSDNTAEILGHYKIIQIHTPKISFPHPRFQMFENQILRLLQGVNE